MKTPKQLLSFICKSMMPDAIYHIDDILKIASTCKCSITMTMDVILTEIRKKNPRIVIGSGNSIYLNTKRNSEKKTTTTETVSDKLIQDNKKFIQHWIETEFEKKLEETVQQFVVAEFKSDILPVLIKHINSKIAEIQKSHNNSINTSVIEFLTNAITELANKEISKQ